MHREDGGFREFVCFIFGFGGHVFFPSELQFFNFFLIFRYGIYGLCKMDDKGFHIDS